MNRRIVFAAALTLLSATAQADEVNEMKLVKVITGMTSVTAGAGTSEAYNYKLVWVGRALIMRSELVCDYLNNTIVGHQELDLIKADGSISKATIPLIQENIETGMCEQLKDKYF